MGGTHECQEFTAQVIESKGLSGNDDKSHAGMTVEQSQIGSRTEIIVPRFGVDRRRSKADESHNLASILLCNQPLQFSTRDAVLNDVRGHNTQEFRKIIVIKSTRSDRDNIEFHVLRGHCKVIKESILQLLIKESRSDVCHPVHLDRAEVIFNLINILKVCNELVSCPDCIFRSQFHHVVISIEVGVFRNWQRHRTKEESVLVDLF